MATQCAVVNPDWYLVDEHWYNVKEVDGNVYVDGTCACRADGQMAYHPRCLPREIIQIVYEKSRSAY